MIQSRSHIRIIKHFSLKYICSGLKRTLISLQSGIQIPLQETKKKKPEPHHKNLFQARSFMLPPLGPPVVSNIHTKISYMIVDHMPVEGW